MSKTINNLVWEVFIEETMGQEKSETYTDRITDYTEDMCYIIYTNLIYRIDRGENINDIRFEDVLPRELMKINKGGG
tara:strand:+ start:710 stop:940 length:231 start_codon:yes stop_codon:yes gene_type:complete